jgi:hypothetical protein
MKKFAGIYMLLSFILVCFIYKLEGARLPIEPRIIVQLWSPSSGKLLVLDPVIGGKINVISPGLRYVVRSQYGYFPNVPMRVEYTPHDHKSGASQWTTFERFETGRPDEVGFVVPVGFGEPSVDMRVFLPSLNTSTQTVALKLEPINPTVYACTGEQYGYAFQTPYIYAGSSLPYSNGQLYTNCNMQNSTIIPRGGNIIIGGQGLARYRKSGDSWLPYMDNPKMILVGYGIELPFVSFYESADHQQQLMFLIPETKVYGSQQIGLTVNGKTTYFIVTLL